MAFTRTPSGLIEKWRFHQVPTVWIEGPSDLYFYMPISDEIPCRFEPFNGCINAIPLVKALQKHNHPYLVILDGDYRILNRLRAPHRAVIILPRYSFENFLWEPYAVNLVCCLQARCGELKDLVSADMETAKQMIKNELLTAITLDVAARESLSPPKLLPEHIDSILKTGKGINIDPVEVNKLISKAKNEIDQHALEKAKIAVDTFLRTRCITHLLKGHLLFGLLRRIFTNAAAREKAKKVNIPNDDTLKQLLSAEVWKCCRSDDHKRLKRSFRKKLREVARRFSE